jgi:hypothetical protein
MSDELVFMPMFGPFPEATRDAENHWYDTDHVPQRLGAPGFLRAERWEASSVMAPFAAPAPASYLHMYWIDRVEAVTGEAYARQFTHPTPRSARGEFPPTLYLHRDIWRISEATPEATLVRTPAEGQEALLMIGLETEDPEAATTLIADEISPLVLSAPGTLRSRRWDRVPLAVAHASSPPAADLMLEVRLSLAEAVTTSEWHDVEALVVEALGVAGVSLSWAGLYRRRTSAWTVGLERRQGAAPSRTASPTS